MISYLTTLTMYYVIIKLNDKTDFIDHQAFENFSENILVREHTNLEYFIDS